MKKDKLRELIRDQVRDVWHNRRSMNPISEQTDLLTNALYPLIESDLQLSMPSENEIEKKSIDLLKYHSDLYQEHPFNEMYEKDKDAILFCMNEIAKFIKSQCKVIDLREEIVKFGKWFNKCGQPLIRPTIDEYFKQQ